MPPKPPPPPHCPNLRSPDRNALVAYFEAAWAHYEWIFSGLRRTADAFAARPHPFRNTLGFYYGHTAAFYVQKLRFAGLLDNAVDERLDGPLERGVSPEQPIAADAREDAPDFSALSRYRARVRDAVLSAIDRADLTRPVTPQTPEWMILMAIEHEFIHLHTSLPLIRRAALDQVAPPTDWREPAAKGGSEEAPRWVAACEGEVTLGRADADAPEVYGWDNEFGRARRQVPAFSVRDRPVTNAEFAEFIADGGYEDDALWATPAASNWREAMAPRAPAAWRGDEAAGFHYRGVFEEGDMPWRWPAEVNRHEAEAYARWAGARVISEAEFQRLRDLKLSANGGRNVAFSTCGVGPPQRGAGEVDLVGGVARWTRDDFRPLDADAFDPHPGYEDFSSPWFGPQHGLLMGASYASLGHMAEVGRMRDFMQNHMDQLAGITLVRVEEGA